MTAKLAFISAHGSTYSIRLLCAVLGVVCSWFYDWQAGDPPGWESRAEADPVGQIRDIFQGSDERYGAPRVHPQLQAQGVRIARKRVARLMRENGIRPARRRKRPPVTTDSRHGYGIAPEPAPAGFQGRSPEQDLARRYHVCGYRESLSTSSACSRCLRRAIMMPSGRWSTGASKMRWRGRGGRCVPGADGRRSPWLMRAGRRSGP